MLSVKDLDVSYGDRTVLSGVTFELGDGELLMLIGPNGAGKSTLLRAVNGSVPATYGEVLIDGVAVGSMDRRTVARRVAVVAQENETKFPITVRDFVLMGRYANGSAFGRESDDDIRAAEKAIEECSLTGFASRSMNELSGGERQRVVLARALATEARLLLLDEPAANLDLAHQAAMFGLVRAKCRAGLLSAVVITHDLNLAAAFADRIICLQDGRVRAAGTPAEVLTAANIRSVFGVDAVIDPHPSAGVTRVTPIF